MSTKNAVQNVTTSNDKTRTKFNGESFNPLNARYDETSGKLELRIVADVDKNGYAHVATIHRNDDGTYDITSVPDRHHMTDAPMESVSKVAWHGTIKFVRNALNDVIESGTERVTRDKYNAVAQDAQDSTDALAIVGYALRAEYDKIDAATFARVQERVAAILDSATLDKIRETLKS
jgi:hypothetical protein